MRSLQLSVLTCLAMAAQASGQATLSLDMSPAGGDVLPGQELTWELSISVDAQGSQGLAAIAADLVTNLPELASGFALSPATTFGLPDNFGTNDNPGSPLPRGLLATLQTIGGAQDTVDNVPSLFDAGPPTGIVPVPFGIVATGVGQGGAQLLASGSFVIPNDAMQGAFWVETGAVPGNPGQTKVNLLQDISEVTRDGDDARWNVTLISPVAQEGVFQFTVVPEPATIALLGIGAAALLRRRRGGI